MLKRMLQPSQTRDEFIEENRKLLAILVTLAERFASVLQEARRIFMAQSLDRPR